MTAYHVRVAGPAPLVLNAVTALADADGVELTASDQPTPVDAGSVALEVTVEGTFDDVADAVADVRAGLPPDASIDITRGAG